HKIRVAISSSNYPRFLNNPNTADGIYANTTYNIAHNTLYLDSNRPSCIILPEIEQKECQVITTGLASPIGVVFEKVFHKM
ncbi:MAG: hypothetical protein JSW60_05560, partial [Thermoplasmatales archaeon]